jgi:hypothetical protein
MGLMIHSLAELPLDVERSYYVYLLDYGWEEPVTQGMYGNFNRMAEFASKNDAVVFRGTVGHHFADEVLSWHHVNGKDAEGILPAILITNRHPNEFRENHWRKDETADKLIIIPLREVCKSPDEVTPIIEQIFNDIQSKQELSNFKIIEEMKARRGDAVLDALILQPNFAGVGVDVNRIINFFRKRPSE